MVAALKIHVQRDAAAKVQDILSVQHFVHATVLVVRVNLSRMKRNVYIGFGTCFANCHYAVEHPLWDKCGGKRAFELFKRLLIEVQPLGTRTIVGPMIIQSGPKK